MCGLVCGFCRVSGCLVILMLAGLKRFGCCVLLVWFKTLLWFVTWLLVCALFPYG